MSDDFLLEDHSSAEPQLNEAAENKSAQNADDVKAQQLAQRRQQRNTAVASFLKSKPELMFNGGIDDNAISIMELCGNVRIKTHSKNSEIAVAFDKTTGELLWETTLPFSGNATPITYQVNGTQFVVIAAGGGKDLNSPSGGVYVGFALKAR